GPRQAQTASQRRAVVGIGVVGLMLLGTGITLVYLHHHGQPPVAPTPTTNAGVALDLPEAQTSPTNATVMPGALTQEEFIRALQRGDTNSTAAELTAFLPKDPVQFFNFATGLLETGKVDSAIL